METPAGISTQSLTDPSSAQLRDRDQAEGYVATVCFKHGPPRLHGVTERSAGRWLDAARDGLADPELRDTARQVAELGADALDHLRLTDIQRTQVLDDLARRFETIPICRRRSA